MNDTLAKYTMVKDRTKTVLVNWAPHCFEYECAYSEENPDGIPLWKRKWDVNIPYRHQYQYPCGRRPATVSRQ
jgi:hypothetical protein